IKTANNLGNVLALLGRHDEAIQDFTSVVQRSPTHAGAHNNLAFSYKQLGRTAEAINEYRQAIAINPQFLEALNNLAWMLATEPGAQFRNGAEAVQFATTACEL